MLRAAKILSGCIACCLLIGTHATAKKIDSGEQGETKAINSLENEPIAPFQRRLLEIAYEAGTAIPLHPHIKDRCRAQEDVVVACLQLDQPELASRFLQKISNWRKGACYADVAHYCARNEKASDELIQDFLDKAEEVAEMSQDWRKDRLRVKIAQVHAVSGNSEQAKRFEENVEASEKGKVVGAAAVVCDDQYFDEKMNEIHGLVETGVFDTVKNALQSCTRLFDRFYDDKKKRSRVESTIRNSWDTLPLVHRIRLLETLAGYSLDHEDKRTALRFVNDAEEMLNSARWRARHKVPLQARCASLRFRSGEEKRARKAADAALELFNDKRERIVNIYRAETLHPVAEGYKLMSDTEAALSVYRLALEEGTKNPNSKPRAIDLCATCLSMAVNEVEPDGELWDRIHQIKKSLGRPW